MPKVSRRVFLTRASLGLCGAAFATSALGQRMGGGMGGGGMGGGGMGGGTGVVDPPVGPLLRDPPPAPETFVDGFRHVTIRASRTSGMTVGGAAATLLTYGGSFVAPTIRARQGEVLRVELVNDLPADGARTFLGYDRYVTNLHVHGWHVSPEASSVTASLPADDVHRHLHPGERQVFEFDLRRQRPGSLGLYHPHVHGSVAEQMWGGLVGALDVEDDERAPFAGLKRNLLVLKDVTIANGAPAPHTTTSDYMHGKEGSVCTVNGYVNPYVTVAPGEVFRFRVINASNARFYRLAFAGQRFWVVGVDGGHLDRPYEVTELLLSPGERADLLLQAPTTKGAYKLLSLPYSRMGMMTSAQITLATVQVAGEGGRRHGPGGRGPRRRARGRVGARREATDVRALDGAGPRVHQRPDLHRDELRGAPLDGRRRRGVDHREPERDGPPVAPARERRAGRGDLGRRRGLREVRGAPEVGAGVEGHRRRAEERQRDPAAAGPRLRRDDDVPLPHPRARGHRHDGHVAHHADVGADADVIGARRPRRRR
jgi:FtsP/CotA-like multicopper oxidase with cupredoxin domain